MHIIVANLTLKSITRGNDCNQTHSVHFYLRLTFMLLCIARSVSCIVIIHSLVYMQLFDEVPRWRSRKNQMCNISKPKTRTGPDFKSEEFVPFRGEAEDWNKLRGLEIWFSPGFRIWNDISYEYSLYWINFDPVL